MQISPIENRSTRAASRDKNYWREIITRWQKSNEHPKDFCSRMNIKIGTFAHWRSVFIKESKQKENKFIPLQITSSFEEKLDHFTIECPSGHKIVFSYAIKLGQVQQIFKLLGITL